MVVILMFQQPYISQAHWANLTTIHLCNIVDNLDGSKIGSKGAKFIS
jgi:hypothetical protein